MRAARRRRPVENEEVEQKRPGRSDATQQLAATVKSTQVPSVTPESPPPDPPLQIKPAAGASASNATPSPTEAQSQALSIPSIASLTPIDVRKPETPLTEIQRRARAFDNLQKLAAGLQKYYQQNSRYPQASSTTSSGIPTLSWRVEILPYLGYKELYDKFDFNKPWNREPNQSLLAYIPDEFVSPERFDTSTNFLLPADKSFMFGDRRSPRLNQIEDGADNTIMLVEVNDSLAVPWTQPTDYVPVSRDQMTEELGGLRSDGTFALWANGWPVLLPANLRGTQLHGVMTYESGDGPLAGKVHRNIKVDAVAPPPSESTVKLAEPKSPPPRTVGRRSYQEPDSLIESVQREPVPKAGELAEAQRKLRSIYATRIVDAKDADDKADLAREMLADAERMESDPSGAFALQTAAMRLAMDGGDPQTLMRIVDGRVARFEVDAFDVNAKTLLDFGRSAAARDPELNRSGDLLRRTVRVIHAGIQDNDFTRSSELARLAFRFTDQDPKEKIPRLVRSLRPLLTTANREYDSAVNHLADYRDNPDNHVAGAALGRFLCFFKGDWETGLPLLTKDENRQLGRIAQLDLQGASDELEQAEIGDAWWELSERARGGVYRTAARERAMHWYEQAYETMPDSLDKMHVKSRIDESEDAEAASPLSLCNQLAEELGVDLDTDLVSLAQGGARRGRRYRDDDDD